MIRGESGPITLSNNYVQSDVVNMQIGEDDGPWNQQYVRVTLYRNWFDQSFQMQPLCMRGGCHIVNNLYTNWYYYAIGAMAGARVFSEANVFAPGSDVKEVTPWQDGSDVTTWDYSASVVSQRDYLADGATFKLLNLSPASLDVPYGLDVDIADENLRRFIQFIAGTK